MKLSLKARYRLIIIGIVLASCTFTAGSLLLSVNASNKKLTGDNTAIFTENFTRQAINHTSELAQQLALSLSNALYFYDIDAIGELLSLATAQSDIIQVLVLDQNNTLVRSSSNPLQQLGEEIIVNFDSSNVSRHGSIYHINEQVLQIYAPIHLNQETIGYILLDKSLHGIFDTIASQSDEIELLAGIRYQELYLKAALTAVLLLSLGIIISLLVSHNLTKPIGQLLEFARELSRGNLSARANVHSGAEFNELAAQLNTLAETTHSHNSQLEYIAHHDQLTGLTNRLRFKQKTLDQLKQHPDLSLAILMLGIDDFKMINDVHGHNVGDIAIAQLGKHLEKVLLSIIGYGSICDYVLARFTGDKFIISLQSKDSRELADNVANELLSSMSEPLSIHGLQLRLTISIGIAISPEHGKTADKLINNASAAMYLVKGHTKNDARVFSQADEYRAVRNAALLTDFSNGIETGELELWYQPQYCTDTNTIFGAEALLRWNHPQLGTISPSKILSLIERHELIHKLAIWTLDSALAGLQELLSFSPTLQLSVNMSPEQLLRKEPFEILEEFAQHHPEAIQHLTIEVTETLWTEYHLGSLERLQRLQALGIRISLDDFATGYSSMSLLKDFPISEIKLDLSFVRDIDKNPENYALSSAIVGIASAFKIDLIAEGIETEQEFTTVASLGCTKFQGFLFHTPMPKSEFLTIINDSPNILKSLSPPV